MTAIDEAPRNDQVIIKFTDGTTVHYPLCEIINGVVKEILAKQIIMEFKGKVDSLNKEVFKETIQNELSIGKISELHLIKAGGNESIKI